MTTIPAITCISAIISFYNNCEGSVIERDKGLFWRAQCTSDFSMIRWYSDEEWGEVAARNLIQNETIICKEKNETLILLK